MKREVVLEASTGYGKRLPSAPVGWVLAHLPDVALRAVRMRFEGRSTVRGIRPGWLEGASDIRVIDVYGADDAHILFECPTLAEGAPELYDQRELWSAKPRADLTALDLVGDIVQELQRRDRDSQLFDRGLLESLCPLAKALDNGFTRICLPGKNGQDSAEITQHVIETAGEFLTSTPRPQRVRVSGRLDMVRASTSAFGVVLETGEEIAGVLVDGDVRRIGDLLTRPVMVEGTAVFRPSGNVLRLEATSVHETDEIERVWSELPRPRESRIERSELIQRQGPRSGIAAIVGSWPGDETDEEIAELLEEIS
ncbi:MAG: hypothetical protein ACLFU7_00750 [Armatimonadota bacterium]